MIDAACIFDLLLSEDYRIIYGRNLKIMRRKTTVDENLHAVLSPVEKRSVRWRKTVRIRSFGKVAEGIYGENATMNTIEKPKIMVTATKNDMKPMDLHLFRNYKSSSEILGFPSNSGDKLMWKVGLSTGEIERPRRCCTTASVH